MHGRVVFVFAQDFTVFGGSLSEANAAKIVKIMDMAMRVGAPVVGLNDSGGARIQEGVVSLAGYTDIFLRKYAVQRSHPADLRHHGAVRRRRRLLPCNHRLHRDDREDQLHVRHRGPDVIKTVTHEDVTKAELGGAVTHNEISGVAHFMAHDDQECLATVRELLSFLPSNNLDDAPRKATQDDPTRADAALDTIVPTESNQPYDMVDVIARIVDDGYLFQVHEHYARNIVVGFARMAGRPVGIVANQPAFLAGVLDINASVKGARFVRFCDAFNIPLITFEDVPGFMPGVQQEHGGIIRHGAKLLYAFAEATVPKLTVITRKAYGGAYCVMSSKHLRTDLNLAWPTAEIAVMGPEGAVNIVYKRELDQTVRRAAAIMPQGVSLSEEQKVEILAEARKEKVEEFRERFANPYVAAERGYIDAVVRPSETRRRLNAALDMLATKREKNPARETRQHPVVRERYCPAGRAHCAWGGHFVARIPCLANTSDCGPPVGRKMMIPTNGRTKAAYSAQTS